MFGVVYVTIAFIKAMVLISKWALILCVVYLVLCGWALYAVAVLCFGSAASRRRIASPRRALRAAGVRI